MNPTEVKKKMMGLWENVFHDSKDYISLIFENYFNPEYVEYAESDGRINAAILGMPYEFKRGKNTLRGLYLIAIAGSENFRQQGLMTGMLDRINGRFEGEFDFTFLIPPTDLMADYYHQQGYFNSFYRVEERFTSVHDFRNDFLLTLADSDERIRELKKKLYDEIKVEEYYGNPHFSQNDIIDFVRERECKGGKIVNLIHTKHDLSTIIRETELRGGEIFVAYDRDEKITGVAFTIKEEIRRIGIPVVYVTDNCSYYCLLKRIKQHFSDFSISLYKNSDTSESPAITEQVYGSENPEGQDLETLFGMVERQFNPWQNMQPYGMVKLLGFENIIGFIAESHKEATFRLFLKDYKAHGDEGDVVYHISKGKVVKEPYQAGDTSKSLLRLTTKELSELLLRKRDTSSLIMEAFGIPRLVLKMALMLE